MSVTTDTGARFVQVRRYKTAAQWPDGATRLCTRCGAEKRHRRNPATVTAIVVHNGGRRLPVGYCPEHVPPELSKEEE